MARVAELVDALDLGSSRLPCESSSLFSRITKKSEENFMSSLEKLGRLKRRLTAKDKLIKYVVTY